eukprot:UN33426
MYQYGPSIPNNNYQPPNLMRHNSTPLPINNNRSYSSQSLYQYPNTPGLNNNQTPAYARSLSTGNAVVPDTSQLQQPRQQPPPIPDENKNQKIKMKEKICLMCRTKEHGAKNCPQLPSTIKELYGLCDRKFKSTECQFI